MSRWLTHRCLVITIEILVIVLQCHVMFLLKARTSLVCCHFFIDKEVVWYFITVPYTYGIHTYGTVLVLEKCSAWLAGHFAATVNSSSVCFMLVFLLLSDNWQKSVVCSRLSAWDRRWWWWWWRGWGWRGADNPWGQLVRFRSVMNILLWLIFWVIISRDVAIFWDRWRNRIGEVMVIF